HGRDRLVQPLPVDDSFGTPGHVIVELFKLYVTVKFYVYLMIYGIIIGVAHFMVYYRRYRDRELATSRLEARLAQTQLQVLRAPRAGPGRLTVRTWRDASRLVLEVADNGPGVRFDRDFQEGIGLANTRARLKALYGDNQSLALRPAPGGGLIVTVALPYRENPPAEATAEREPVDLPAVAISPQ